MSRSERLFDLIQILRRHRRPVSGRTLADEMGVSIRTLYRDIATLQGQGAPIEGEAGLGYVLKPGFMLPPLMFSDEEIEAIVLGSRWVAKQPDKRLAVAATDALAKIAAVLPDDLREDLDATTLLVGPNADHLETIDLGVVRQAIRDERKLGFLYRDAGGSASKRLVWPFALSFFDKVRVMVAWCEMRQDFRHFRADRMSELTATDIRYPRRRQSMLKEWRATLGTAGQNGAKDTTG
ncbi:YafY family transcriptional regulator [Mesorhizobium sp. M2D.F.Ca.ET.185.01.1.1]|uniref:helix-turn-helix transcriptional regulator n=1 Tax=unclassified Mesorhizobium TaxID=325217 RepID=UPI000FCC302C|nr:MULTISPECIES: YafY family protein [unclassified Mesorhizobium]TGP83067.1 YafY family transcriptional regulator [bacterium M00.F.Ca.ET.227.01.1.1]TGP99024.1 YafY family transcriptional regulator [bacterium M00.F.Ca.ET.221.01.1.1]TGP99754.1 YafY family transcriptional regulator [bacterium M00.F.Ca.ET.222.01.1.1]TGT78169.1 YafY family transcriptional regulator [bacterium M00.F.Ca.ET.159.01.1.1]TGT88836.1 YafY family transcriptional regulator [bacterium M00.F.Ca.ET.157.01.1.1]TGU05517.1 YafY f